MAQAVNSLSCTPQMWRPGFPKTHQPLGVLGVQTFSSTHFSTFLFSASVYGCLSCTRCQGHREQTWPHPGPWLLARTLGNRCHMTRQVKAGTCFMAPVAPANKQPNCTDPKYAPVGVLPPQGHRGKGRDSHTRISQSWTSCYMPVHWTPVR